MATQYQRKPLKVKIAKYQQGKLLERANLIDGKFLPLEVDGRDNIDLEKITLRIFTGYKGWLVGSLPASQVGALFDCNFISNGEADVRKETEYLAKWKEHGCLYCLDATNNATLEYLAEIYQGVFAELNATMVLPGKLSEEQKKLLNAQKEWQLENKLAISEDWELWGEFQKEFGDENIFPSVFFSEVELTPKKGVKPIITPEFEGNFLNFKLKEITLPEKGKKNNNYNNRGNVAINGYMALNERLDSILSCLEGENKEKFDKIYSAYLTDSQKTLFALSLTGLNVKMEENEKDKNNNDNGNFIKAYELRPDRIDAYLSKLKSFYEANSKEFNLPSEKMPDNLFKVIQVVKGETKYLKDINLDYLKTLIEIIDMEIEEKKYPDRKVKLKFQENGFKKPLAEMDLDELKELLATFNNSTVMLADVHF